MNVSHALMPIFFLSKRILMALSHGTVVAKTPNSYTSLMKTLPIKNKSVF